MLSNLFVSLRRIHVKSNRRFQFDVIKKKFCQSKMDTESKLEISKDPKDSENIIVKIPKQEKHFYEFGLTNDLPLYENFQSAKESTGIHIPLNKTNILLFGGLAVYAFYTSSFQMALLVHLYIFNKFLLKQNRKITEIVYISLLPDFETIYIRTHSLNLRYDIGSLQYEKIVKLGKISYMVLKDKSSKMTFYLNAEGKILNRDLVDMIISGEYFKVSFEYV